MIDTVLLHFDLKIEHHTIHTISAHQSIIRSATERSRSIVFAKFSLQSKGIDYFLNLKGKLIK